MLGNAPASAMAPVPSQRRLAPSLVGDLAAGLLLTAAAWLLYHRALGLWFTHDDFFNLRWVLAYRPAQYCLDPAVWRRLPFRMLTPLLFVSHDLDLALFGTRALPFHAHQLVALALATLALYALLRLWLPPPWAATGAFLFLAGPPIAPLAALLYVRHYLEAVLFGIAAAGVWVLALRSRRPGARWSLAALSAVLYLAAALAKEVAVPLVLLLPLLPEETLRRRLRLALPHAAAVGLYAGYRLWMLGTAAGGYGWAVAPGAWPRLAASLPLRLGRELLGEPGAAGALLLAGLLAAALVLALAARRNALLIGWAVLLAVLPVLPVATEVVPRYAVASWVLLAVAFPFGARRAFSRIAAHRSAGDRARTVVAAAVVGALCLAALAVNRQVWARELARDERTSAENRAFLDLGPGALLAHPAGPPSSMNELAWFKEVHLGLPAGTGWYYDDLYLCTRKGPLHAVWEYDPASRRVREVTAGVVARRREFCPSIAWRAPLEAEVRRRGAGVFWTLGPYPRGEYAFVFGDGRQRYDVPRTGGFQLPAARKLSLRVRYRSPEGWVTYSPELAIPLTGAEPFRWRRPASRLGG